MSDNVVSMRDPSTPKGVLRRVMSRFDPRRVSGSADTEEARIAGHLRSLGEDADDLRHRISATEDPATGEFRVPMGLAVEVMTHLAVHASESRLLARKVEEAG